MRRVIVESPYAPRTPLPEGQCPRLRMGHVHGCDYVQIPMDDWCVWCEARFKRSRELEQHQRYLAACLRDCLRRGEAPFASHGLYTLPGVLRDDVPEEREAGITAGFKWRRVADATVLYVDLGWSKGMLLGAEDAKKLCESTGWIHQIEERNLGPNWEEDFSAPVPTTHE